MDAYILMVEDDADVTEALVDVLSLEGYRVVTARNGQEALDYMRVNPLPCLILLDLMMPVMNGQEFRKEQLQNDLFKSIPTFVTSAAGDDGKMITAMAPTGQLRKPLDIDALLETVARYCPKS